MKIRDDIKLPHPVVKKGHWLVRCVVPTEGLVEGKLYIISGNGDYVGAYTEEYKPIGVYSPQCFVKVTKY